jgi:hypothetical protein
MSISVEVRGERERRRDGKPRLALLPHRRQRGVWVGWSERRARKNESKARRGSNSQKKSYAISSDDIACDACLLRDDGLCKKWSLFLHPHKPLLLSLGSVYG